MAGYRPLVASIAARLAPMGRRLSILAEEDDLIQEGLIYVWRALAHGVTPSADIIEKGMRSYIRKASSKKSEPLQDWGTVEFDEQIHSPA